MEKKERDPGTEPLPWGEWIGLCAQEPYRILFPLGTLLGAVGVAVWPLFFVWGVAWAPPSISHPRMLIEGFVGSFVIGFLGTSVPRLLEVERFSIWETGGLVAALSGIGLLHLLGLSGWGDLLFGSAILFFLGRLASRFPRRRDNPPPSFLLALFGLLGAAAGGLWIAAEEGGVGFSPFLHSLALLLLYQGLPLLPILGVGAFLLPRFYGLPSRESLPEARIPTRAWILRALAALVAALGLFASFAWEAAGGARPGGLLRAATVVGYLFFSIPASRDLLAKGTVAGCARWALSFSVLGLLLAALSLSLRVAWLHLFFLGGAGLLILTVGARVVLGFSGRGELLAHRYAPLSGALWWILGAILLRVAAELLPAGRGLLLTGASLFWLGALLLWSWPLLPKVRCPDVED